MIVNGFHRLPMYANQNYVTGWSASLSSGNNDLYTCPAGKKAIILNSFPISNPTGGSITAYFGVKISGIYHRIVADLSIPAGAARTASPNAFVLNAGQSLSVNLSAGGAYCRYAILEIEDTAEIETKFLQNPSTGDNNLYIVPAGKKAIILHPSSLEMYPYSYFQYTNESGASRTIKFYIVPAAGSPSANNLINTSASVVSNNATTTLQQGKIVLDEGESIVFNVDDGATNQLAYISIIEFNKCQCI